jgi:hypothetical protein
VTKAEAEQAVRHLVHVWAKETGLRGTSEENPSFLSFKTWLETNHYSHYLKFRSVAGPRYDAEMWFDHELKQMWRR